MNRPWTAAPVPLTVAQVFQLEDLIDRLIAFRDALDGDTDMEPDQEDRCEAREDQGTAQSGWSTGDGLPGDPDDAEPDDAA